MIERMVEIECPLNRNEVERHDGSKEHLAEVVCISKRSPLMLSFDLIFVLL